MKLSVFVDVFLVALYNETLNRQQDDFTVGGILDAYSLKIDPIWKNRLKDNAKMTSFAGLSSESDDIRDARVSLSSAGFEWAENAHGENVARFLEENGAVYAGEHSPIEPTVDSASWTGLPRTFKLTDERRERLVRSLNQLEDNLSSAGLGQETQAQARAYVIAARVLAEAPDPPSDLIWELVNRANAICGIASLFVSVIGLFV